MMHSAKFGLLFNRLAWFNYADVQELNHDYVMCDSAARLPALATVLAVALTDCRMLNADC